MLTMTSMDNLFSAHIPYIPLNNTLEIMKNNNSYLEVIDRTII